MRSNESSPCNHLIKGIGFPPRKGWFLWLIFFLYTLTLSAESYQEVIIHGSGRENAVQQNIAVLLADRLKEAGLPLAAIPGNRYTPDTKHRERLHILLCLQGTQREADSLMQEHRIAPLTQLDPGPEGFLLFKVPGEAILLAVGTDERGTLYAVGEFLRETRVKDHVLQLPDDLNIRTAPAFEVRGTQVQQSDVARKMGKARPWTVKETQRVILDYALAGANVFSTDEGWMYDFLKSFGLMTQGDFGANAAAGPVPAAWNASESIGRSGYVCLSVPDARKYMLEQCEKKFSGNRDYDFVKFYGGDGGGCECDKCKPYGLTFIKTVAEMADIIHKYHPATKIYFTNQKFDNNDDQAIFAYLQEKPREWLWAWGYGPGSDATTWQPGHRQTHRMDLFRYPGYGPYGLYPKEIIRQMPPRHKLLYYNEITHWKYAQHAFVQMYPRADKNGDLPPHWSHDIYERRPDQFLTMVYNRLSFYACPRNYYRVFQDLMPYGSGDITHSSGHHDHFNQWMWQRLLWNPRTTLEEVVESYCRTWFGPEAAPSMAKALLLLEQNIGEQPGCPLDKKESVQAYCDLVAEAGRKMDPQTLATDWCWRMYRQKGWLDRYTQLKVRQQKALQARIEQSVAAALQSADPDPAIRGCLGWFDLKESEEMKNIRLSADRLGEESNRIFGERNDGLYNLEHDFIGLGWLKRQLERALVAKGKAKTELLQRITDYENPGEGGFYDNLGTGNKAPHVVAGYPYDHGQPYVAGMLSEGNRPSQRSLHFTQDEKQGVTLHYSHLDPKARYKIRVTLVRPWYQDRYAERMVQKSESIYANDLLVAKDVELPLQMSDFFTFDLPAKATESGEMTLRFEKSANVATGDRVAVEQWRNSGGWGTLVAEVWLMKR
ncbi:MAG: hypothetical protein LWW85_06305 [Marinilabiliales bacterium]|nr:hypothetical protein [Marinilabiliales bacterium]